MGNTETHLASAAVSGDGVSTPVTTPREGLCICSVDARTCEVDARNSRPESMSTLAAWKETGAKWQRTDEGLEGASQAHTPCMMRPELMIGLGLPLALAGNREEGACEEEELFASLRSSYAGAPSRGHGVSTDAQGDVASATYFCEGSSLAHVGSVCPHGASETLCGAMSSGPSCGRGGRVSGCSSRAHEVAVNRQYSELLVI